MNSKSVEKKANKEVLSHIVTGVVVILKGIDKIENPEKFWFGLLLLFVGLIILSIGVFHHQIENRIKNVKPLVFFGEAIVMAIVGYIYWHDNKTYIQYVCFVAAFGFLVAGILKLVKKENHEEIQ